MNPSTTEKDSTKVPIICIALVVVTVSLFWQVTGHEFLKTYDDHHYVTENKAVQNPSFVALLKYALTTTTTGNWHPVTWISHWIDWRIYGDNPFGHHLTSVLVHAANAALLFFLLFRISGHVWRSAFVAAVFAVHPLRAESVAWVSERKDVLSLLFGFITLHVYVIWTASRKVLVYALAGVLMSLSLMSKPMLVSMPALMLLLDYWPLRRANKVLSRFHLLREKWLFIAVAAAGCAVALWAQSTAGAMSSLEHIPLTIRVGNALVSIVAYIGKLVWPVNLAVIYPHPLSKLSWGAVIASAYVIALVTLAAVRLRRHGFPLVGWLWYLITGLPVVGLVQIGSQAMADRYTYLPTIGLLLIVAWGAPALVKRSATANKMLPVIACVVVAVCGWAGWTNLKVWNDDVSLFASAVSVNPHSEVALNNLGFALLVRGRLDEARQTLERAIRVDPANPDANYHYALLMESLGESSMAIKHYCLSLAVRPNFAPAANNLAWILATSEDPRQKDPKTALELAKRAVSLTKSQEPEVLDTLAAAYFAKGLKHRALKTWAAAERLARSQGNPGLAHEIHSRAQKHR